MKLFVIKKKEIGKRNYLTIEGTKIAVYVNEVIAQKNFQLNETTEIFLMVCSKTKWAEEEEPDTRLQEVNHIINLDCQCQPQYD